MVLINVTTFGVAIGTTALAVEEEDEDGYKRHFFLLSCIARSWLSDPYTHASSSHKHPPSATAPSFG